MFSVTTIESSTSRPSATTKPAIDNWFSEKPAKYSAATPVSSDSGIDTMTMPAARSPSGSRVTDTSTIAIRKSADRRLRRRATLRDWSKPRTSSTPAGNSPT
jgi:hypothetical protein